MWSATKLSCDYHAIILGMSFPLKVISSCLLQSLFWVERGFSSTIVDMIVMADSYDNYNNVIVGNTYNVT